MFKPATQAEGGATGGVAPISPNQSHHRRRSAIVGAVVVCVTGLLLFHSRLGWGLADLSLDLPFLWRANQPVEGITMIYLDENSATELGQDWSQPVLDRAVYARLVNRLKECHARAVVFDVLFDQHGTNEEDFVTALKSASHAALPVILGGKVEVSTLLTGSVMTSVRMPISELTSVASCGLAETGAQGEPIRRHFSGLEHTPTLAVLTAERVGPYRPWRYTNYYGPPGFLSWERWINFYGPPRFLPKCSYSQALDPMLTPVETFSNKVCFVGALNAGTPPAGGMRVDEWRTPYSRWGYGLAPGVEITATVYLNLIREDWLARLSPELEALLVAITGLLVGFGFVYLRPTLAIGAGVLAAVAVTGGACWWMWHSYVWFSWLILAAVEIPVAVGWSAIAHVRRTIRDKALVGEERSAPPGSTPSPTASTVVAGDKAPSGSVLPVIAIPEHTLLSFVGRGGYGEVWLARNAIGTYHAVKIVRRDLFDRPAPFEREFRGLEKFMPIFRGHPGLVHILQVGRREAEGFIYYVMQAADDEITGARINSDEYSPKNLGGELRHRGHMRVPECVQLGLALTEALDFLHQHGLIHRDVKPANIIFVQGKPKLADIGLVTELATPGAAVTYVGTKGYIAPEGPGTTCADVYSLGVVLYEASMGLAPECWNRSVARWR